MTPVPPLIHRYLEDRSGLGEEELDQLVALLREDPQLAAVLREQLLLDDYLSQKLAIDRQNFFAQVEQRVADYEAGIEEMYDQVAELRAIAEAEIEKPATPPQQSAWLKYGLAAALVLGFAGLIAVWQLSPAEAMPIALIQEIAGEVTVKRGGQEIAPQVANAIHTGDEVLSRAGSSIVWKYKDGTTVRLVGDSATKISANADSGAKQVALDRGELVASVVKQQRGPMVFSTPHATATVRGTELRLVVSPATTQLDVTEGRVDLMRLSDREPMPVAANETAIASRERITVRMPQWPLDRSRAMFVMEGDPGQAVTRNPETMNFRATPLEPSANASGSLVSPDAGEDLVRLLRGSGQFTCEIAFTPQAVNVPAAGVILSLGPPEKPLLELRQEEGWVLAQVAAVDGPIELNLGETAAGERAHVVITCRPDRLSGYLAARQTTERTEVSFRPADWADGPLVLRGDAGGGRLWSGEVHQLAIFRHAMNADEVRREHERFKIVYPKTP